MTFDEGIAEVLLTTRTAAGDDGDGKGVGQFAQCFVGIALLHTVVVHRREEYLARSTILRLTRPLKESALRPLTTAFQITVPTVFVQSGVDGTYAHLRAEAGGDLIDQFRSADGG